jgi:hypothetical protein
MSKATIHQARESQLEMENVQVNVQMNVEMKAHDETMAGTEAARCVIGHMKRMKRKHSITGKLDNTA